MTAEHDKYFGAIATLGPCSLKVALPDRRAKKKKKEYANSNLQTAVESFQWVQILKTLHRIVD